MVPAEVAFSSLLSTLDGACPIQFVVLCNHQELQFPAKRRLEDLVEGSERAAIRFIDVGNAFSGAFEIRNITVPTYYRLLLPDLLPEFDRVLYLDVDTVIVRDISPLFHIDLGESLLAGVKGIYPNRDHSRLQSLGIEPGSYVNAGVLLMNLDAMRRENLQQRFLELARRDFTFQDQDILNLTCQGRIRYLPPAFNVHAMFDYRQERDHADELFGTTAVDEVLDEPAIIHYAGNKPWETAECFYYDRWWQAYRASPGFDRDFYLDHQRKIIRFCAEKREAERLLQLDEDAPASGGFRSRFRSWARKVIAAFR